MLLSVSHFLFAVNEATEVRLLASITEVERAPMIGIFLRLAEVGVTWSSESLVLEDSLLLGVDKSLLLNLVL